MITPEEFFGDMRSFPIRKEDRYDEPLIDDFIRGEKCGICGAHPPSTVSHLLGKGRTGNWASSVFKMPKCMACHGDFEALSLEEFELKHGFLPGEMRLHAFLWAEKITQHLCQKIRELTGDQKTEPRKAKVRQPKKPDSVFKKVKGNRSGLQKCTICGLKSFPVNPEHYETCSEYQG
jgi:hypothetical protein